MLGLQSARMEAALVGHKRQRAVELAPPEAPEVSDVYARTRALLSFLPPELADGVARVRRPRVSASHAERERVY